MRNRQREAPRIAFCTRISTDEDHQKYSLGAQERLEAFCRAQWDDDWNLRKVYRDTESDTHTNRPGLEEMLYGAEGQHDRYFEAFEAETLTLELCNEKVRDLRARLEEAGGREAGPQGPAREAGAPGRRPGDARSPRGELRADHGRRPGSPREAPPPPAGEEGAGP